MIHNKYHIINCNYFIHSNDNSYIFTWLGGPMAGNMTDMSSYPIVQDSQSD